MGFITKLAGTIWESPRKPVAYLFVQKQLYSSPTQQHVSGQTNMLSVMYVLIVVITTEEHWCHYGIILPLVASKNGVYAEPSHGVTWEKLKAWKLLTNIAPCGKVSLVISGVGNFLSFKVPGEREEVQKGWATTIFFRRNLRWQSGR